MLKVFFCNSKCKVSSFGYFLNLKSASVVSTWYEVHYTQHVLLEKGDIVELVLNMPRGFDTVTLKNFPCSLITNSQQGTAVQFITGIIQELVYHLVLSILAYSTSLH